MKIKSKSNRVAAFAALPAVTMLVAVSIVGLSSSARAQYGQRVWSPPEEGVFFSVQLGGTNAPPTPFLPFDVLDVPLYLTPGTTNSFVYDDSEIDYTAVEEFSAQSNMSVPEPGEDGEGGGGEDAGGYGNPYVPPGPNDFWIELLSVDTTNQTASLTLHGTKVGFYYELLQRASLNVASWSFAPVAVLYDDDGTNQLYFDLAPTAGRNRTFYLGAKGYPLVSIIRLSSQAVEPAGNDPGQIAIFDVRLSDPLSTNLTVVWKISGSASNGVDYTTITGSVTIPAGESNTNIVIQPSEDSVTEFEETVTLSLVLTNGYLVNPEQSVATVTINDNYGTADGPFETVTNLVEPVGIDYSPTLQSLIVSVNYDSGETNNFVRLYTNGANQLVVTNWSGVHGVPNEVKVATVKSTVGGFTNSDVFFGSDASIGWLSADGTRSNLTWCTLTNSAVTNALYLRGGLYLDATGVWSNNLIAVASDDNYNNLTDKGVWRVDGQGHPTLITRISTWHLEGAITIPNTNTWGPWAGKILVGDEDARDEIDNPRPLVFSIETNGMVAPFAMGIAPEDFDIIPPNQDLYCAVIGGPSAILKLPSAMLTNYVGDLLITQEGAYGIGNHPPMLFIVHWDAGVSNFVVRSITVPNVTDLEHVTFAPIHLPSTP